MFQLKNVTIQNHPVFGFADINFGKEQEECVNGGTMTSVIIGRNGIGKSYLLRAIVDIFKCLDILRHRKDDVKISTLPYRFAVNYNLNDHEYTVTDIPSRLQSVDRNAIHPFLLRVDGNNVDWRDIQLPCAVIASSMTIADKFPTPSAGIYKYRGVRNETTPSTTGTRTIVRKAVEGIIDSLAHKHTTRDEISIILSELGFQSRLEIKYSLRYKNVFVRQDMNPEQLHDIYTHWRNYFPGRKGEVWGARYYQTLVNYPDKINKVCEFLRRSATQMNSSRHNLLVYDVFDEGNTLVYDADAIKLLSNLDILSFPEFKVYKANNNEGYDFVESSSGETQQLCQFISIMSAIEHDSLILIDEPENSSHPNWQMNYIGWLQQIFRGYRDCHFLIATHSHFLLTDMKPEWSTIVALDSMANGLKNVAEGMNTYCWSTDDILYRVFRVRNTRNYAFEHDLYKLYDMLSSKNKDTEGIRKLVNKLNGFVLGPSDPLKSIIESGKNYVEHN